MRVGTQEKTEEKEEREIKRKKCQRGEEQKIKIKEERNR